MVDSTFQWMSVSHRIGDIVTYYKNYVGCR